MKVEDTRITEKYVLAKPVVICRDCRDKEILIGRKEYWQGAINRLYFDEAFVPLEDKKQRIREEVFNAIHKEVYHLKGGSGIAAQKATDAIVDALVSLIYGEEG